MQRGNIYIINAFDSHCTSPGPNTPYIRSKITFSSAYIHNLLNQAGLLYLIEPPMEISRGFDSCITPDEAMRKELDEFFHKINFEAESKEDGYMAFINAYFLKMFAVIYRCISVTAKAPVPFPKG